MKMRNLVFLCTHPNRNVNNQKTKEMGAHDQYSDFTQKKKQPTANFPINLPDNPFSTKSEDSKSSPQLDRSKSDEGAPDMRISEQDLGSDADSLPSCGESLTASESPPNSPELFKPKAEVSRRDSAPASINLEALENDTELHNKNEQEIIRELHRRYSSVEEHTNRVRFQLQESFEEEEERFNKQFKEKGDSDLQKKFSDIEGYKIAPAQYPRKVSSPPCLTSEVEENIIIPERKTSADRSRKCSVFTDTSGSLQILPGQEIKRVSSPDNIVEECPKEENRKISLQDHKLKNKGDSCNDRKFSLQDNHTRRRSFSFYEKNEQGNRKFSLQIPRRKPSFSDRKLSLQERKDSTTERITSCAERKLSHGILGERKHSLVDRKLSSADRKISAAERKISSCDRKISSSERKISSSERKLSSTERKYSSSERKHSSSERKLSQEIRKVSLSDTLRSVVGTKKKHERKHSQETLADENNNPSDKKSTWGLLKNKIKKDRKPSNDMLMNGSPRMLRLLSRHDSSSSVDSGTPRRTRRSDAKRLSRTEDYDQKSVSSFNSLELDDSGNETQQIVPKCAFEVWSEGKGDIDLENKTLPLLHVAAAEGNKELLITLLDVGVDTNEIDASGWPALHYAICSGHFECAQLLLGKGATLQNYSNKVMNNYCSAIRDCIRTGSPSSYS